MMENISVPSRFSCLKIEDEEFFPVTNKSNKKKTEAAKPVPKKGHQNDSNHTKKSQQKHEHSSNAPSKKSKSKNKNDDKQWEEWQKKDNEYIDENFELDLQSAILQSKLDYENQKKNHIPTIPTNKDNNSTKKKKVKTMSLDEFLESDNQPTKKESESKGLEPNVNFFESVVHSTKEELRKEKVEANRRERVNNIEEVISLAQCQEKLQKEKEANEILRKGLEEAKKEITVVKKRNKMLCSMLSQGEMKDKATVLLELEKLNNVKEELTEEVSRLYKLLEQERSKNNSTNNSNSSVSESHSKQKNKKKKT